MLIFFCRIVGSLGPALLSVTLWFWAWKQRRAWIQGRGHHHFNQPDWWKLVWGHDTRGIWLLPNQLCGSDSAFAPVRASVQGFYQNCGHNLIALEFKRHFINVAFCESPAFCRLAYLYIGLIPRVFILYIFHLYWTCLTFYWLYQMLLVALKTFWNVFFSSNCILCNRLIFSVHFCYNVN